MSEVEIEGKEKLKGLFVGDLVAPTGFSQVMHNIIKFIRDDFEITGVGVNYYGDPHDYDFPIYPARIGNGNIYGIDRVCNLLNSRDFDFVFILNDAWVISYYLDAMKKHVKKKLPKIVVYFPVDSRYHDPDWYRDFDIVTRAFTYTEFGKRVVSQCRPELEPEIMPHGIDTNVFYKAFDNRLKARKRVFTQNKDEELKDLFIVLNANRNQPRKKLDITMAGFGLFAKDKPNNVKLYMHSGVRDSHIDLIKESRRYGIEPRLILTSMTQGIQKVSLEKLNLIYNACDVGINTSLGEGWGLINMEHAVTGAVQIVPRHSSCEELFSDCGMLMETYYDWTFDMSETVGRVTTPEEVARCLEVLYRNPTLRDELAEKGRKKFIQTEYEWKTISLRWGEVFSEVCSKDGTNPVPSEH